MVEEAERAALLVEPRPGRETQPIHWFRVCVAEWHNGVNPRAGVVLEELLVWDKGRHRYVLEVHRYGRELPHECRRSVLEHDDIRAWVERRAAAIVWRDDAQGFYPPFVRVAGAGAPHALPIAHAAGSYLNLTIG